MEAAELQPVPNEQEDGDKQEQEQEQKQNWFERDHWTELVQQAGQQQEEERVEGEDPIVVQQEFFGVPGYRACVRLVRFVVRSIEGYSCACRLDP